MINHQLTQFPDPGYKPATQQFLGCFSAHLPDSTGQRSIQYATGGASSVADWGHSTDCPNDEMFWLTGHMNRRFSLGVSQVVGALLAGHLMSSHIATFFHHVMKDGTFFLDVSYHINPPKGVEG